MGTTTARLPVPGGQSVTVRFDGPAGVITVSDVPAVARWLAATSAPVRAVVADQTHQSVVVGERVVVKFLAGVEDAEHPALRAVSHLAEVGFTGMPTWEGALTVQAPSGRFVPLALMSAFLPGATDGWSWCVDDFPRIPAELGTLAARLHAALATPSSVIPAPVSTASPATWSKAARARLSELSASVSRLDAAPAGPDGDTPRRRASMVFREHRPALSTALATLPSRETTVQPVHGDLHVGQFLRWTDGLAITDFDGNPVLSPAERLEPQPAARDLAQLLVSIDQVGRIVDRRSGFARTAEADAWSTEAREAVTGAYVAELSSSMHDQLFDLDLLPAFIAEQCVRDLLYSVKHLPRWAYATLEGLPLLTRA